MIASYFDSMFTQSVTVQPLASCYGHQAMQNRFVMA